MTTPADARADDGTGALFVPEGSTLVPTAAARGPWSPDALHGGPVAALVARCVERHGDNGRTACNWRGSAWSCSARFRWRP